MITAPVKNFLQPVEEWLVRVGPVSAYAKNADVDCNQRVNEGRELKSAIRRRENDQPDDSRKNFETPGETTVRMNSRPDENNRHADQKNQMRSSHNFTEGNEVNEDLALWDDQIFFVSFVIFCLSASSTAKLIAAIMLSGLATPLPAISNAVP
jgi:hypothetical protein